MNFQFIRNFQDETFNDIPLVPEEICLSLLSGINQFKTPKVELNSIVLKGQCIAESMFEDLHSSISGKVVSLTSHEIKIKHLSEYFSDSLALNEKVFESDFQVFLSKIGLLGMGGSRFPSSLKIKYAKNIHTLVINGVECEPHINIDKIQLLKQKEYILEGVKKITQKLNINHVVLVVKKDKSFEHALKASYPFEIRTVSREYPSGAEKLILHQIFKKRIYAGTFPTDIGYLFHNVTSIRSIGKALMHKLPVIERPLSLIIPSKQICKNFIIPIGMTVSEIFSSVKFNYDPESDIILAGGLMMGTRVSLHFSINKGTNSIFVIKRQDINFEERPCINCGACSDQCPLKLHPIAITLRIKQNDNSDAFYGQLKECFLCGNCSLVCPASIPISQRIKEGQKCSIS